MKWKRLGGCWTAKELERQIDSLYYERSGLSKNKRSSFCISTATGSSTTACECNKYSLDLRVLRVK